MAFQGFLPLNTYMQCSPACKINSTKKTNIVSFRESGKANGEKTLQWFTNYFTKNYCCETCEIRLRDFKQAFENKTVSQNFLSIQPCTNNEYKNKRSGRREKRTIWNTIWTGTQYSMYIFLDFNYYTVDSFWSLNLVSGH